ncbi:MAG: hypothetical protein JW966_04240 [Anaerolineae bacterium]|nr:hypothetical protein [Anaerolineae bacterium]
MPYRHTAFLTRLFLLSTTLLALVNPSLAAAQSDPDAWTTDNLRMHTGPGLTYEVVTVLERDTSLVLEQRSADGSWLRGHTRTGTAEGWVAREYLRFRAGFDVETLPIPAENPDTAALCTIPILPTINPAPLREVFERGQRLGNHANVFTTIGDCNTDNPAFMFPIANGLYDLGPHTDLQPTIDFFAGSFDHHSAAGRFGYSAAAVLDPIFADPALCKPGESSVQCEFRRTQPGVVFIMFGANDVVGLTDDQYTESINQMVSGALDAGIIPVLSTFAWCANDRGYDKALALNLITADIASTYDIPLINFWLATQSLDNCGMVTNSHHLTQQNSNMITFNGEEKLYGNTMRTFLTLQVLDRVRREVIAGVLPGAAPAAPRASP